MEVTEINLDALELKYERLSVKRGAAERRLACLASPGSKAR